MNKQSQSLLISLALLTPAATAQIAPLPADHSVQITRHIQRLEFQRMLDRGLNSAGDKMLLEFRGAGSVPVVALVNVGGGTRLEIRVQRLERGVYELCLSKEDSAAIGIELTENNEGKLEQSKRKDVLFHFADSSSAASALSLFSQIGGTTKRALQDSLSSYLRTAKAAAATVRDAVISLQDTRAVEQVRLQSYRAASASLRTVESKLQKLQSRLSKAKARISWLKRKVRRTPKWLRKGLYRTLRGAQRTCSALSRAVGRSAAHVRVARERLASKRHAWVDAKRATNTREHALATARAAQRSARETYEGLRDVAVAIGQACTTMARHHAGFEYEMSRRAQLEASLNPFGIQLANVGMSAAAGGGFSAQLRLLLERPGRPMRLELLAAYSMDAELKAGFGVGGRTEAEAAIEMALAWERRARSIHFEGGETSIVTDLALHAVVGAGVVLERGLGIEARITMSFADWQRAVRANRAFFTAPSLANLKRGLAGIHAEYSLQSRRLNALAMGVGGSVGGGGLEIEGGARWVDLGSTQSERCSVTEVLDAIFSPVRIEASFRELQSHLPR